MPNRLQKAIYYITAEAPALVIFAIVYWYQEKQWGIPVLLLLGAIDLYLLFDLFFKKASLSLPVIDVEIEDFEGNDRWLLEYGVTYLLPITSFWFDGYVVPALLVVMGCILIAVVFSDHAGPHPLLALRGYHFYTVSVAGASSGYTLISKKRLRNKNEIRHVNRVFERVLLRVKG